MNVKQMTISLVMLIMLLVVSSCGIFSVALESPETEPIGSRDQASPTATVEVADPTPTTLEESTEPSDSARHEFSELGISMEIPAELYVKKEPLVNYDDQGKLDSYLFYIQNYGNPGGPPSGNFQMYGHLQYNLPPVTWEQFIEINDNSQGMYEYITPIEINGLKGYDAQFVGPRNRYVYTFYLQGHVLTIAVADPTPENKARADEIVATLQFNPEQFTDDSHMTLVSDPAQLYQVLLPDDWEYSFQPTIGTQLSSLEASSPDSEVFIDNQAEGPHANIYYQQGISLHIQVIDDDSLQFNPGWPDQRQYGVYFNGVQGTVYVFREPSTAEGEIRTVHVAYEGRSYLLRFGYAEDADQDTIDRIMSNFIVTPVDFYPTP